MATPCPILGNI
jgi:hypothetical protein